MQSKPPKLPARKIRQLITAGVALLALFSLAAGLSQVVFKPGEPVDLGKPAAQTGTYSTFISGSFLGALVQALYGASIIAALLFIIYMLIDKERRKQLGKALLRMLPLLVLAYFASQYVRACTRPPAETATQPAAVGQATPGTALPTPSFTPALSTGLILAVSVLLALVAAVLVTVIIIRLRQGKRQTTPLLKLAEEAQAALDELDAGGDLRNAVLRCYYEMNRILLAEKGLQRDRSMTPREFEVMLAAKGLPDDPIQQLTRLFEAVRYGASEVGETQESVARSSLSAIISACRSMS